MLLRSTRIRQMSHAWDASHKLKTQVLRSSFLYLSYRGREEKVHWPQGSNDLYFPGALGKGKYSWGRISSLFPRGRKSTFTPRKRYSWIPREELRINCSLLGKNFLPYLLGEESEKKRGYLKIWSLVPFLPQPYKNQRPCTFFPRPWSAQREEYIPLQLSLSDDLISAESVRWLDISWV